MNIIRVPGEEFRVPINASASGDNTLLAGVAGKNIIVHQFAFTCVGAVTITFEDEDGNVLAGPWSFDATGGAAPPVNLMGMFKVAVGKDLIMNLSSAVQVGGFLYGTYL